MKIKMDHYAGETIQKAALLALFNSYDAILFNDRLYKVRLDIDEVLPGVDIQEIVRLQHLGIKNMEV